MEQTFTLKVNDEKHKVNCDPETPLLYVLRNQLQLNGPKYGCGKAQCGSCMVLIDKVAQFSCILPINKVGAVDITTLDGLGDSSGVLHKVQQAFYEYQVAQCGYCTNGLIMATVALLDQNPTPSEAEIKQALDSNLCRCGIHSRALKAIHSLVNP